MELKPLHLLRILEMQKDLHRHADYYEAPPEGAQCIGIFEKSEVIGYFVVLGYDDHSIDIVEGYLKPEARHKGKPKKAMELLENLMKAAGYKIARLQTHNRFKAYTEFAKGLGYSPLALSFKKELK